MSGFQNTIDLLGDDVVGASVVDRSIVEFYDNVLKSIGEYAFDSCAALTNVNLPTVTNLGKSAFSACKALANVNLPNVTNIDGYAFYGDEALVIVDLPRAAKIGTYVFNGAKALTTLILRSETMCTLDGSVSFNNTPFASNGTGGTVYVPQALIESYKTATNWSSLYAYGTCNFVAIEGSEYE